MNCYFVVSVKSGKMLWLSVIVKEFIEQMHDFHLENSF